MKKISYVLATGFAAFALANSAQAALTSVYTTGFNAPTYTDGPLTTSATFDNAQTPGQDGWLATSATGTNNVSVTNTSTNGVVALNTTGQDVRHPFAALTSGSVFLQADINVTAAQSAGDYFIHLGDNSATNFYARTFAKSVGTGFALAVTTSSGGTPVYGATLNFSQVYNILVKYDIVAGTANDTVSIFVNPTTTDGSGDTAYIAGVTTGTDATSIASVNLRQGSATNAATVTVDNIVVSSSLTPEPATLTAVAGLGSLIVGRRRRA